MLSREQILKLMREKVTHPATPRELTKALKVPQEERPTFRRLLKSLVTTGELVQTKAGRDAPDVYVSATNIKEAMHGDRVLARIERRTVENRLEGRIIRILERGNS